MSVSQACARYFSGFQEINAENDCLTNSIAVAKIASYCTVVLPVGVGIAYGISSYWEEHNIEEVQLKRREMDLKRKIEENKDARLACHHLPLYVSICCKLAGDYHRLGNAIKPIELVQLAKECANQNQVRKVDYLGNLLTIAETEKEFNVEGAYETIRSAVKDIVK
ncbi:MAG: hypothetical protein JJU12_00065 [Chlamydiales bacterium]|nr:hypothetical protein [Chlamydiales bacterium]